MRSSKDPYRRPFWLVTLMLPAVAIGLVLHGRAQGVGVRPDRLSWGEALAMLVAVESVLVFLVAWMLIAPAPRAGSRGGKRVLRLSGWRRAWMAAGLPGLGWPLAVWAFARGDLVPGIAVSVLAAGFTAILLYGTTECVMFDSEEVRKVKGTGAKDRLRWDEVTEVVAWPSAVLLKGAGRRVPIAGVLLDGYPEFVNELLTRVRPEVIDAAPGVRAVLERVASLAEVQGASAATR